MVGIAIFSSDPVLRRNLEQPPRDDPAVVIVGMVDQASSLGELDNRNGVDVLMADVPTQELLAEYRAGRDPIPLVVLLEGADGEDAVRALNAGARAVVDRSASGNEIIAAVKAVSAGLVVMAPCIGARRKGTEGHCGKLRANWRSWVTPTSAARRTPHHVPSRLWKDLPSQTKAGPLRL